MTTATTCLIGGRVFDGAVRTTATAVAIQGGRIAAIGDDDEIRAFAGPGSEVIDVRGGLIAPGFVDAHAHVAFGGVERLSLDLTSATSVDETLAMIQRAALASQEPWITGGGWSHELFPHPTREMLDAIVADRPVALSDAGHHTLWVNSLALRLAGVTSETPDPPNGQIYRDDSGEPTGYLNETAAELVGRIVPPATEQQIEAGLLHAQDYFWGLGITGWHEAILGESNGKADCTDAYLATLARAELPSLVSGALWIPPGTTADRAPDIVERFTGLAARNAAAGFPTMFAKMMVDGVPHGETAALHEQYCSHQHRGELHIDAAALTALAIALDKAGFGLHLHAMGDRAVTVALDAIEAARRANGNGPTHQIAHLSMIAPTDAARFGPLDVAANMQALWAAPDAAVVPMIGEERMRSGYPFRSLADSGALMAMGSDWPVSPPDPWLAIHVAVNRSLPFDPLSHQPVADPDVLDARQRLTLAEALAAYTSGSSRLALGIPGRLRIGARADLAISSADPFELPAAALISITNTATVVNGEVRFRSEGA